MDINNITKEYKNEDITVSWQSGKCIHSGICARRLATVFKPRAKPWIQMENGSTIAIKETIDKCPSGALSYKQIS